MNIDRYTKFVLTIIAFSTFILAISSLSPVGNVFANKEIYRIAICDHYGTRCADIDGRALKMRNFGN